jgi:ABC-type hemin transport system ATPase subunit
VTIEVKNIVKKFGAFAALDRVDLKVANGELLALLGRRARARLRCCGSSRGWIGRIRARSRLTGKMRSPTAPASAMSGSYSSTTRCSAT